MSSTQVVAAQAREARRERTRRAATAAIARLSPGERVRLQRDFDRATLEARFISNRGRH
ncbi:hypothetical protein [Aeromicrobium sp. 179-A 4D2 NHS]|uniref:hypothetical protein n=1 Tax=Aeromicrobium sp. 179-A 4D2 NHS TaxID=3142375 RepID=UPI0039A154CF